MSTQLHDALHELAREHDDATEIVVVDLEFRDSIWIEVPRVPKVNSDTKVKLWNEH
jgi:hypothetical protein